MTQPERIQRPPFVETFYDPAQLVTASPGRRLGASLLDGVLVLLTLGVGWIIWFFIVAPRGQTPAKSILNMYTMREDGTRAGGGYTWVRELVFKGIITSILGTFTFYVYYIVAALWCTWDRDRQCLWDKMASTYIAYSQHGYMPPTANDLRLAGAAMPVPRFDPASGGPAWGQ